MITSLETRRCRLVPLLLLSVLLLAAAVHAAELTGSVKALSGEPLPARVLIVEPQSKASVLLYTDTQGNFKAQVPEGKLQVLVTHGPEWSLDEREAEGGEHLNISLRRLVDMPARGYYGADLHMHSTVSDGKQSPEEVALACRAEGLHIAALTDHETVAQHEAWLAQAAVNFLPLRGQEVTTKFGHVVSVNCPTRISNAITSALGFEDIFAGIHAGGGFAIVAHPSAPGMLYMAAENRKYDAMEILNGSIPPHGGIFDFVQARKNWHALLSQGHRIAAVGNSDNHDNLNSLARQVLQHPEKVAEVSPRVALIARMVNFETVVAPWAWKGLHPGTYRTYLQLDEVTAETVQQVVKTGRGFVTNGPLILATLDDQAPGTELALNGRASLNLRAELYGNRAPERLEIVINGQKSISLQSNAGQVQVSVPVKAGDWVTAELYGPWPEFATTNAWYVK